MFGCEVVQVSAYKFILYCEYSDFDFRAVRFWHLLPIPFNFVYVEWYLLNSFEFDYFRNFFRFDRR